MLVLILIRIATDDACLPICQPKKMVQALRPVFSVSPACDDTDNSNERRQSDPIHRHGCLGEARVRNAKECKNQHQEVGPLPCEKCARVEGPSIRCGIVRLRVSHRSWSDPIRQELEAHTTILYSNNS